MTLRETVPFAGLVSLSADRGLDISHVGSILVAVAPPVHLQDSLASTSRWVSAELLLELFLVVSPPFGEPVK